jgi:hypothetical protein
MPEPLRPELNNLTREQQAALLELVVLAEYADGHLTSVEDVQVEQLLIAMGVTDPYDRQKQLDAVVTRIRRKAETPGQSQEYALSLASHFTSREQQRQVYSLLQEIVSSDAHITAGESGLLEGIRAAYRLWAVTGRRRQKKCHPPKRMAVSEPSFA